MLRRSSRLASCRSWKQVSATVNVNTVARRSLADSAEADAMEYSMVGKTGLQVSKLSFGFWATFGVKPDLKNEEGIESAMGLMRLCRRRGVNCFDNAEVYGDPRGSAELVMGEAIQRLQKEDPLLWRRSELVLTTKLFWGGDGVNEKGLSRKHIMEGIDASLERLQVDYVDLLFCHRPDQLTPPLETVRAMSDVVSSGKALYWGTSEWSAQQITEAFWIAKMEGLIPPVVEQPEYNMFKRDRVELEYKPLYSEPYGLGTTIWSPLASGILTGKYNADVPSDSRLAMKGYSFLKDRFDSVRAERVPKIEKLMEIARRPELNCSVGTLAIAWCMKNPNVSTVLLGATKLNQLDENMESLAAARKLTPEIMDEIDEVLGNAPTPTPHWARVLEKTF